MANHYIRDGASGVADGSDWTNAWTDLPVSFVRGDTYYVADGNYGGHAFDQATSGTTWIYVKKAISSDHGTETGWDSGYGDGVAVFSAQLSFGSDYWELNGQTGSDRTGHGFEVVTNANDCLEPYDGADHITIKYVNAHCYAEGTTLAQLRAGNNYHVLYALNNTNLTVQYCYFHHVFGCNLFTRGCSDILIEHSYFSENAGTVPIHAEAWSDDDSDNVVLRYNKFCDIDGTGFICCMNGSAGDAATNWAIYGNVFWDTGTFGSQVTYWIFVDDGVGSPGNHIHAEDWYIYNNTLYRLNYGITSETPAFTMYFSSALTSNVNILNNLIYQGRENTSYQRYGYVYDPAAEVTHDYNYWGLCAFPFSMSNSAHENSIYDGPSCRLSDESGFPGFTDSANDDFSLTGEISGYEGTALASPYDEDMTGNTRGNTGIWTIGAYQYGSSNNRYIRIY